MRIRAWLVGAGVCSAVAGARASPHAYHPVTCSNEDVVGRDPCRRFGAWSSSLFDVTVDGGVTDHTVSSPDGAKLYDRARTYTLAGGRAPMRGARVGVGMRLGHNYLGLELQYERASDAPALLGTSDDGTQVMARETSRFLFDEVVGVSEHLFGPVGLREEVVTGMAFAAYDVGPAHLSNLQLVVEGRVGIDAWIAPHLSLGILGEQSVLAWHDRAVTLTLGWHGRVFGGAW